MTNNIISISVPNEFLTLMRAAEMLTAMAKDCVGDNKIPEQTPLAEGGLIPNDTSLTCGSEFPTTDTPPENDIELDKAGFPWDERIHGEAKKKTAKDKRWTKIKNLDKNSPGLFDKVIAELTAAGYGTVATGDNVVGINSGTAPAPVETLAPPPPAETLAPTPAVEASYIASDGKTYTETQLRTAGHTDQTLSTLQKVETTPIAEAVTFPVLMSLITPALASNAITQEQITAALAPHGIASLPLLSAQPQLVPAVKLALFG